MYTSWETHRPTWQTTACLERVDGVAARTHVCVPLLCPPCEQNYSVHAVMYLYYYLMCLKAVPKWFPVWIITLAQILQVRCFLLL